MSFNGAGLFVVNSSGQPVVTGTTISATVQNALTADIATGLSTCILKDGTQTTSARIPFLFGISSTLTTDSTSIGTGSIITSGGVGVTKALWVGGLANIAGAVTLQSTLAVTGAVTLSGALQSTTYLSTSSIVYLGGTTASEVSLRRSLTELQVKLGDGSAFANVSFLAGISTQGAIYLGGSAVTDTRWVKNGIITESQLGDGSGFAGVKALNFNTSDSVIFMGGTSASEVSLRRSTTTLQVRLGNNSGDANLSCGDLGVTNISATNVNTGGLTASGPIDLGGADYSGLVAGLTNITIVKGVVTAAS